MAKNNDFKLFALIIPNNSKNIFCAWQRKYNRIQLIENVFKMLLKLFLAREACALLGRTHSIERVS